MIRYADYLQALGAGRREMSFRELVAPGERGPAGRPGVLKLDAAEIAALLRPYVSVRFMEQFRAVVPLALYLALFQIVILRQLIDDSWLISGGLLAVIVGLMLFMEGLKLGLMPLGELIGSTLPCRSPLPLVRVVGASVGLAAVVGTLRFLYGWSLKPLIYASLVPVLGLTLVGGAGCGAGKGSGPCLGCRRRHHRPCHRAAGTRARHHPCRQHLLSRRRGVAASRCCGRRARRVARCRNPVWCGS
jgi:hypothetical protein